MSEGNGNRPVYYIPIGGTRAWNDRGAPKRRWWQKDSDFAKEMAKLRCVMLDGDQPFVWTTDLNGVQFWRRWSIWFGSVSKFRDHRDWVAGGENLIRYCDSLRGPIPYADRNFITHSHGFQVWAYAAALGLKCRRLISISPPVRRDMEDTVRLARGNVELWTLVVDKNRDSMANLGALGDGVFRRSRIFDAVDGRPDYRIAIPNIGHSGILEGGQLSLWGAYAIDQYLR